MKLLFLTRALFLLIPLGLLFLLVYTLLGDTAVQWPLWLGLTGTSIALFGPPHKAGPET